MEDEGVGRTSQKKQKQDSKVEAYPSSSVNEFYMDETTKAKKRLQQKGEMKGNEPNHRQSKMMKCNKPTMTTVKVLTPSTPNSLIIMMNINYYVL